MAYLGLETIRRGNTAACVKDIFDLHFPTSTDVLDCTFGKGRFWSDLPHLNVTGVDIDPPVDDPRIIIADYRELPFQPGQFQVMTFDPMFIFSRGIMAVSGTARQFMGAEAADYNGRTWSKEKITSPKNPVDLLEHYRRIFEQRDLATHGLICKGQDLITGTSRDYWSVNVINMAREMGLGWPKDVLIQHSPAARMVDKRWKNQHHFRTAHCSYIVWKFNA